MTFHPIPLDTPGWDCVVPLPIPPQAPQCTPETTVADLGPGTGSGMDTAMDSARDLANAPADAANAEALHDLIYPAAWWADLSTVQLAVLGVALVLAVALMVAVLARRTGGAS